MSSNKNKGPIYDPGVCRCCGAAKKCRLLNAEYEWMGQKEIYSDMFVDSFGLLLSHLDGEPEDRLICATCVLRLREATSFRRQVLQCEVKLLQTNIHVYNADETNNGIKQEIEIKSECKADTLPNDNDVDDNRDDSGDTYDNDESIDVKLEPPSVTSNKKVKGLKKMTRTSKRLIAKNVKGTRTKNREHLKNKRDLLLKMKETSKKIKKLERDLQPEENVKPIQRKVIDHEERAFQNTIVFVENSFVCPFDSSFSDYYCVYCRDIFTDPHKLREHNLTHDPSQFQSLYFKKTPQIDITRIDCRLCPEKINEIDVFKRHITSVHGKCLHQSVTNEFLKYRLTIGYLSCTECNRNFPFFHALKKHMAEHFGTCICDICGAHYFEERMLDIHQKTHQRKVDENFPCKDCGKSFKSKHSRYLHIARTHKKEPAYQCNKCDEVLFSYALRYRHMIEVHGQQRLFPCENCDRTYDTRKSLREHNRRTHLKIFKHQCDLCDKRFYLPCRLKEHMATHTGERNFRCEYCGKSYPRLRGLKVHMQSHASEKKYKCMLCNASFTQNVNLKNHIKKQHQSLEIDESFQGC